MAKSPTKKTANGGKKSSSGNILAWVVAIILGIFALPTLLLLLAGMAPTLVAFFILDRHPSKYTSRAVGYLNFSGCLPYAIDMWRTSTGVWDFESLALVLQDPFTLLVMYSMAAVGWLILFAAPPVVAAYLTVTHDIKEKAFKARQKELIAMWGKNVRLGTMGAEIDDDEDIPEGEDEAAGEAAPSS